MYAYICKKINESKNSLCGKIFEQYVTPVIIFVQILNHHTMTSDKLKDLKARVSALRRYL